MNDLKSEKSGRKFVAMLKADAGVSALVPDHILTDVQGMEMREAEDFPGNSFIDIAPLIWVRAKRRKLLDSVEIIPTATDQKSAAEIAGEVRRAMTATSYKFGGGEDVRRFHDGMSDFYQFRLYYYRCEERNAA